LLLTIHEEELVGFGNLRERLRHGRQAIRNSKADYLAVMVIDSIVDGYFPVLEHFGDFLDRCEERVLESQDGNVLSEIYAIRRDLSSFRRAVWPLREVLQSLSRNADSPIEQPHHLHLRDILDHVQQTLDFLDSYRELASSLVDAHLNIVGQKTNEVMKVLTIVSTVFIPLTFIAGVYGMNFDTSHPWNQPELRWQYGYVVFWVVDILMVVGLLGLFRHLGWLGRKKS